MTDVLIKGRNLDIDSRTMPCEEEDRDWGDCSTSQAMPKITIKPPGTKEEA